MTFESLSHIARQEVREALAELPREIRDKAQAVPVFLERLPNEPDLDPDLLGLFDPGPGDLETPRIRLWLDNIWDFAERDLAIFREEVRITFLHEIGHLIGWGEEDLEERGLG